MENNASTKHIYRFLAVLLTFVMVLGTIPAAAKVKNSVTVGSKKALFKEMVKEKSKTIYYETEKEVKLTITKHDGSENKRLVINAPNATIVNKAAFKAVIIKSCKSYTEAANGNIITLKDGETAFKVSKSKNVKSLTVSTDSANISLGKKAKVAEASIGKNYAVTISGAKSAEINIISKGKGSSVESAGPVVKINGDNVAVSDTKPEVTNTPTPTETPKDNSKDNTKDSTDNTGSSTNTVSYTDNAAWAYVTPEPTPSPTPAVEEYINDEGLKAIKKYTDDGYIIEVYAKSLLYTEKYNNKGNLVQYDSYLTSEKRFFSKYDYKYDDNNRLLEYKICMNIDSLDPEDIKNHETIYIYSYYDNGYMKSCINIKGSGESTEAIYNENVEEETIKTIYKDEQGKIFQELIYENDRLKQVLRYDEEGNPHVIREYYYDENGKVLSSFQQMDGYIEFVDYNNKSEYVKLSWVGDKINLYTYPYETSDTFTIEDTDALSYLDTSVASGSAISAVYLKYDEFNGHKPTHGSLILVTDTREEIPYIDITYEYDEQGIQTKAEFIYKDGKYFLRKDEVDNDIIHVYTKKIDKDGNVTEDTFDMY